VNMVLSNRDAPNAAASESAPVIGSSMSAAWFTTGVLKIRVRVSPLPLGVWGVLPSAMTAGGMARGAASLAGIERDSSNGREIVRELALAADRRPKKSPTGLERSTWLKVKGAFLRFLGLAICKGIWYSLN
jgi:hypothetical protein